METGGRVFKGSHRCDEVVNAGPNYIVTLNRGNVRAYDSFTGAHKHHMVLPHSAHYIMGCLTQPRVVVAEGNVTHVYEIDEIVGFRELLVMESSKCLGLSYSGRIMALWTPRDPEIRFLNIDTGNDNEGAMMPPVRFGRFEFPLVLFSPLTDDHVMRVRGAELEIYDWRRGEVYAHHSFAPQSIHGARFAGRGTLIVLDLYGDHGPQGGGPFCVFDYVTTASVEIPRFPLHLSNVGSPSNVLVGLDDGRNHILKLHNPQFETLWAFLAGGLCAGEAIPANRFFRGDGDNALMRRVRAFLFPLFTA